MTTDTAVQTYVFDPVPGRRRPRWMRTVFVAADGTIFAPAAIGGAQAWLCAAFDGVPAVSAHRHVYLPTTWLRENYPDADDILDRLEARFATEARR